MYYLIVTTANVLIRISDVRMVLIWFDNAFCFYLDSFRCVFVYFVKFLFFVPVLKKEQKYGLILESLFKPSVFYIVCWLFFSLFVSKCFV